VKGGRRQFAVATSSIALDGASDLEEAVRVLLTGATGLIGSAIAARLLRDRHEVIAVARRKGLPQPGLRWVRLDLRNASKPDDWVPHLEGVGAVINCAGVLQDGISDATAAAHAEGPAALFAACEKTDVRRVIHFSAIGVDRETPTEFSRTKAQGDRALMLTSLDWVILRPSVVVGRAAYGGSALFRGLAALPVSLHVSGAGKLQVVQLDDVVDTVIYFLGADAPGRVALDIAGPDALELGDIVAAYRRWYGWQPAYRLRMPRLAMDALYRVGDLAGRLGWRPPIRTTAQREIIRGAVGDPGPWTAMTGIVPRSLADSLAATPASVQERWFARLYLLKPVLLAALSLFWIVTGLISLGPGWEDGIGLMFEGGAAGPAASATVIAGALADIGIGIGIAFRRTARPALYAAIALSLAYAAVGTVLVPRLWIEPLGPLLKILPILALHLAALAIIEDR
jgi:uncharacterized protein YbjT (DUF2867 family)